MNNISYTFPAEIQMDTQTKITCELNEHYSVIQVIGDHYHQDNLEIQKTFQNLLEQNFHAIIIDFTLVQAINSLMIGTILGVSKQMKKIGKILLIVNPPAQIKIILDLARTQKHITIFSSMEAAVQSLTDPL